jgi:hypothetical protein
MRSLALLLLAAGFTLADTVICKDKRRIEGKIVEETEAHVKLQVKNGAVTIPRYQIERVERGATTREVYEARRDRIDPSDAKALLELARWCAENNLKKEAQAEFSRVIGVDPENAAAHEALGHVFEGGRWMTLEEACRAKGLVEFDGLWMTPEEAKLKAALKEKQELEKAISEKVRECLRKLASANLEAREEARAQLEQIPAELKFQPLLEHVESRTAEIRAYAIGALSAYNRPEVMPRVARRALVDDSEAIRGVAMDTLRALRLPETWIHLQKGLQSEYSQVRVRAANAICEFPDEGAAEALMSALSRVMRPKGGFSVERHDPDPRFAGDPKMTDDAKKALGDAGKLPSGGMNPLDDPSEKAKRDQEEREKAALVRALEKCTGLAYGDNLDAWREWWLKRHAATAAKEAMGGKEKPDEDAPKK